MSGFVASLRVRPEVLSLVQAGAAVVWILRVQAADVWDAVRVECVPEGSVRDVKLAAMANLLPDIELHELYVVKYGGSEIRNETLSLQEAGLVDDAILFLAPRNRRPLR